MLGRKSEPSTNPEQDTATTPTQPSLDATIDTIKAFGVDDLEQLIAHAHTLIDTKKAEAKQAFMDKVRADAEAQGIDISELFAGSNKAKKTKGVPKYRHPDEPAKTWTGKGKRPAWLVELVESGRDISEFEIH